MRCISAKVVVCCPWPCAVLTAWVRKVKLGSRALAKELFPTPECPLNKVTLLASKERSSSKPSPVRADVRSVRYPAAP